MSRVRRCHVCIRQRQERHLSCFHGCFCLLLHDGHHVRRESEWRESERREREEWMHHGHGVKFAAAAMRARARMTTATRRLLAAATTATTLTTATALLFFARAATAATATAATGAGAAAATTLLRSGVSRGSGISCIRCCCRQLTCLDLRFECSNCRRSYLVEQRWCGSRRWSSRGGGEHRSSRGWCWRYCRCDRCRALHSRLLCHELFHGGRV